MGRWGIGRGWADGESAQRGWRRAEAEGVLPGRIGGLGGGGQPTVVFDRLRRAALLAVGVEPAGAAGVDVAIVDEVG